MRYLIVINNKMKKLNVYAGGLLTAATMLFGQASVFGQSYADSLKQDAKDILSSIAPYQSDMRSAILEVSQYPQALVKIERVQARSSQSFQDLVAGYSREEQEKLYDASRFPELVAQLTRKGQLSDAEVKNLTKDFPAATQTRLVDVNAHHYSDLVRMNDLYNSSQDALDKIITAYPKDVQADFRKVIGTPDVVNLLTDNIDLTVSLGEEYRADPSDVRQQLDNLNADLTAQNEKDLAAYKTQVENDPKLQKEMRSAATEFSSTYDQQDNPTYVTNNYYDNYPYPYWFSYPYWYSSPIWYPRPIYYHTGFYYGPGGGLVVVGLPSPVYSSWFFGRGYRRYPTLYHQYNSYYAYNRYHYYDGYRNGYHNRYTPARHDRSVRSYPQGGRTYTNGGAVNGRTMAPATRAPRTSYYNNNASREVRKSQMNVAPSNFNSRGIQQYHATTYHSMGWQNVGSGNRGTPQRGGFQQQRPAVSQPHNSGSSGRTGSFGGGGGGHSGGSGGGRGRH